VATAAIERDQLRDIEVMWVDHQGHARGQREHVDQGQREQSHAPGAAQHDTATFHSAGW